MEAATPCGHQRIGMRHMRGARRRRILQHKLITLLFVSVLKRFHGRYRLRSLPIDVTNSNTCAVQNVCHFGRDRRVGITKADNMVLSMHSLTLANAFALMDKSANRRERARLCAKSKQCMNTSLISRACCLMCNSVWAIHLVECVSAAAASAVWKRVPCAKCFGLTIWSVWQSAK